MKTEKQIAAKKLFAGEKKASMKRRDDHNDYQGRKMYMITMEVEGRRPLFGKVVGDPFAPKGSAEAPHMELSFLGTIVQAEWQGIPRYYPQIEVMAIQIMPDHLHGILFVHEKLPIHLGQVLAGFKKGCERKWKAMTGIAEVKPQPTTNSPNVTLPSQASVQAAAQPQQTSAPRLFALGYNDLLLKNYNEFGIWKRYLAENPYRLAMKRARPDLLRVRLGIDICGSICSAVGNLSLLSAPSKMRVRISRSMDPALLEREKASILAAARMGTVLVSAAISPGEKAIIRTAFDEGLPLIVLLDNGLDAMSKPSGERFRACAEGRLLLLSPFPHRNERVTITRGVCDALNSLAWHISGGK
ncbi:MAG: transposase [Bacteroidaceae bacterium]|nr:transposase [Bacteroidaceae bacterium]